MLILRNLNKRFEERKILENISLEFHENCIYKLEGSNGIGKTTLLKLIKGIVIADEGEITFKNKNLSKKLNITFVDSNNRSFIHRLTVLENLSYFSAVNKLKINQNEIEILLGIFNLQNYMNKKFSNLSLGQMQLVSVIRGLIEKPDILLLDEVFSNLDENNTLSLCYYLEEFCMKDENMIIIASHGKEIPLGFKEKINLDKLCSG
tara:strand:+ start:703 stop:1320 length:618 start_codon:yes stop_codon:yes gene_type:complete